MSIIIQVIIGLALALGPAATTAGIGASVTAPPIVAPLDTIQPHP